MDIKLKHIFKIREKGDIPRGQLVLQLLMSEMQRWFLYQTFVHKNQTYYAVHPLHLSYSLVLYAEIQINLGPGKSGGFPLHARVPGSQYDVCPNSVDCV